MEHLLDGMTVIITGGSRGIGEETVKAALLEGANVAIFDVRDPISNSDDRVQFIRTDITKESEVRESFQKVVDKFGRVDGLVNNAAYSPPPLSAEEIDNETLIKTFSTNVFGAFLCTKYAVIEMIRSGMGSVVNISSVIGRVGSRNSSVYAASKSALLGMTKSNAVTYASRNIRFNAVLPGYVKTPLIDSVAMNSGDYEKYMSSLASLHPIGRIASPSEISGIVVFLLSKISSFITGSEIIVDGGYTSV